MTRKRLGFSPVCWTTPRLKSATGWPPSKFATRNAWDSTARGSLSTIFMSTKAACRRRWSFSPTPRRTPSAFVLAPPLSPCPWKTRCGWRRMRRCWICSPMDGWRWASAPAAPHLVLPFGLTMDQRSAVFAEHLHLIQSAWRGDSLAPG